VIDGQLSTGSLVALMAYHARLLSPVQNLMSLYTNLVTGGVSLTRVFELFDTPRRCGAPLGPPWNDARGEIECQSISFPLCGDPVFSIFPSVCPPAPFAPSWTERCRQVDAGRLVSAPVHPEHGIIRSMAAICARCVSRMSAGR